MATPVKITAIFSKDKSLQSLHAIFYDVDHNNNVEGTSCQSFLNNRDGSYDFDFYCSDDQGKKTTDPNDKRVIDNMCKITEGDALEKIMDILGAYKPFKIEIVEFGKETIYDSNAIKKGIAHLQDLVADKITLPGDISYQGADSTNVKVQDTKPAHQTVATGFGFSSN